MNQKKHLTQKEKENISEESKDKVDLLRMVKGLENKIKKSNITPQKVK